MGVTRGLSTAQENAAKAAHSTCALLIEAVFDSGTIRGSTCGHDLTVDGNSYPALNKLRSVEALGESTESTEGLRITLDSVDAGIITILVSEPYRGRPLNLYEVWLDSNYAQIGNKVLMFPGLMTAMMNSETGGSCTIVVEAEHFEKELRRPRETRYNDADQRSLYPTDKGCEYVESLTELMLVWPSREALMR